LTQKELYLLTQTLRIARLAFPDHNRPPAHSFKCRYGGRVSLDVAGQLWSPILLPGVVTLSEISPIWTINQRAKSLKFLASTLAVVGKFRSV
jgi:hypothetical protein